MTTKTRGGNVHKLPARARRPMPPAAALLTLETAFVPAPEVKAWLVENILQEGGALYNPEHQHLLDADLHVLWTNVHYGRQGRVVLGQCEQVMIRAGGWQKARQEMQMVQWFGDVPAWLITLSAPYCDGCTDDEFCALVEHELYHIGHKPDDFGMPSFTQDGLPRLAMRGHDVEEFVGVVKRYGVGDPGGAIAQMAAAARGVPSVGRASIAAACGTCMAKSA